MQIEQVVSYLRWLRYVIDVTLRDKTYVIVNVDETSVNAIDQKKNGYVGQGVRRHVANHQHQPVRRDRSDIKTTLMAVICDQPELQPYLPQVFMPKYTQNASPPACARAIYVWSARVSFPVLASDWRIINTNDIPEVVQLIAFSCSFIQFGCIHLTHYGLPLEPS